jgi:hypothetical protein
LPRCDVFARQPLDDRRKENEVNQFRIELRSSTFADDANGVVYTAARLIAPSVRDRVERVGDGDNPRFEWNTLSLETARIPGAVPSFVV